MGRKGVGKLAPLGICEQIEVITSGGDLIQIGDLKGYITANFTLVRTDMMQDSDEPYTPTPGCVERKLRPARGTTIRMSKFDHRRVPKIEDFDRQLARRFGVKAPNWELVLRDSQKTTGAKGATRTVGELEVDLKPGTKIEFREITDDEGKSYDPPKYGAFDEEDNESDGVKATFEYEGRTYPVLGWMGYSKYPYRDDLMAGVRIYCRGKFAAQTNIFNMKAGFTGEYDVRSYLVGVLDADWLDEEEDLILTGRSDILWSDPLAQEFEAWGQRVVRHIGSLTREPMRKGGLGHCSGRRPGSREGRGGIPRRTSEGASGEDARDRQDHSKVRLGPEELEDQKALQRFSRSGVASGASHHAGTEVNRGI